MIRIQLQSLHFQHGMHMAAARFQSSTCLQLWLELPYCGDKELTVGLPAASNDIVIHAILKGWISCTGVMVHINVMCTDKVN